MKLKELIFHTPFEENDIRTKEDLYWILDDVFNLKREEISFHYLDEIDENQFFYYWNKIKNTPLQYLLGYSYFLGYKFKVNKSVLIPRNETEELVLLIKEKIKSRKNISILDIGTGSGAIILTLEMLLNNNSFLGEGVDISIDCLKVAQANKELYHLNSKLYLSDVFENVNGKYDVIVSNPPYIKKGEFVEERVLKNEPLLALYAKNDGLEVYKKIIKNATKYINKNGFLAFEISPERKKGLIALINKYLVYNKYEFINDINDFERYLFIYF